jgi:hypothetical protein
VGVAVVFVEGLLFVSIGLRLLMVGGWIARTHHVVIVLMPLLLAEQRAERADGSGVRSDSVERTEIHHVDRLNGRQVRTRQIDVQAIANRHRKDVGPLLLRGIRDATRPTFFKVGANLMVQRVVQTQVLGDLQDLIRIRSIASGPGTPVDLLRCVVSLRPVASRLDYTSLARRAKERGAFRCQSLVTLVELDARVYHLSLAELCEFVGAQSVLVVGQEGVLARESWDIRLELFYDGFVQFCF